MGVTQNRSDTEAAVVCSIFRDVQDTLHETMSRFRFNMRHVHHMCDDLVRNDLLFPERCEQVHANDFHAVQT